MGHKLGQVFLHDKNILSKIVSTALEHPTPFAVEIGCGDGILTEALANHFHQVIVYEIDPICIEKTRDRTRNYRNIEIIPGDVLDTANSHHFPENASVVANVPYYITTPIIKLLISQMTNVSTATLMVQREFADKMIAKPGDDLYGSFTIYSHFHFKTERLFYVSKNCFSPVPKVDSAVIRLTPSWKDIDGDRNCFFSMVQSGFWGRRKPFASALSKSPYIRLKPGFQTIPYFRHFPKIRAEDISPDVFLEIFDQLTPFLENR
ncbi:ribosomal RNA small subunit methyltransferase A [bacterium]|nr:ribosomal RNA small subunit methyltransferase A [bacterium]